MDENQQALSAVDEKGLQQAFRIDQGKVQSHLDAMVRQSVQQTLNQLLDAEAEALCNARKYQRSPERVDSRASHYQRKLQTSAGEVTLTPVRKRMGFGDG